MTRRDRSGRGPKGPGSQPNGIEPSYSCCLGLSIYQRRLGKTEISSNLSNHSLAGSPILSTYYSRSLKCANTTKKTLWCFEGISEIQDSTKQPHSNLQRWHLSYWATKFSKKKIMPSPNTNFLKLHTNLSQWHKDSNQPPKISVASRGCHLRVFDWGHQLINFKIVFLSLYSDNLIMLWELKKRRKKRSRKELRALSLYDKQKKEKK